MNREERVEFFESFIEIVVSFPLFTIKKLTTMTTNNPAYICRYSGRCIMFNMIEACRVAKLQGGERGEDKGDGSLIRNYGSGGEKKENMSEVWENEEDEGNFLIVRLIADKDDGGTQHWVVAHQGMHQIFCAPLFVPIVETNTKEKALAIFLRDHANRSNENGIKRKFWLKFDSIVELFSFQSTHNAILKGGDFLIAEQKSDKEESKKKEDNFYKKDTGKDGSEPALKKRKISAVLSVDFQEDEERRRAAEKKKEHKLKAPEEGKKGNEENEDYNKRLAIFEEGDGIHDVGDEDFENTQNPFDIDVSF